jgi:K+-sensing histidine kinase KdpD
VCIEEVSSAEEGRVRKSEGCQPTLQPNCQSPREGTVVHAPTPSGRAFHRKTTFVCGNRSARYSAVTQHGVQRVRAGCDQTNAERPLRRNKSESWREGIYKVGWLSTSIAHDLRNPLGTICAGAEMLMDVDATPAQVKRLAANIHSAAGRMHELLTDLVSMARGRESTVDVCDIRTVIGAALAVADTRKVRIVFDAPDAVEAPLLLSRMQRVFVNLIANSVEAMPTGGTLRIAVRKAGNSALAVLEDSGPGIPPEIRSRLFEPFVTAGKENGIGLGLAFCRQTVLEHGGDIWSEPVAKGARFVIRLPLKA